MSNKMPEKVLVSNVITAWTENDKAILQREFYDSLTPYIRSDLVDELIEVTESLAIAVSDLTGMDVSDAHEAIQAIRDDRDE